LTKESQASGASKIAALSNDAHALSAGQPVKADRIEEVELREDMACLREYRFRVLESGVMRLYQLDSGRFAVKRGTDFYIYRNLESAGAAYADKIGLRQGYLRDAIGSFNANQLLRDLFNRGEL
jgi:hypothetical protein